MEKIEKKTFKQLMIDKDLSALDISLHVRIPTSHVYLWMHGDFKPSAKYRIRLAEILGEEIYTL
jgi:hypothetical protein